MPHVSQKQIVRCIRIINDYIYHFCNPEYLMFELMKMLRGGVPHAERPLSISVSQVVDRFIRRVS